MGPKATARPSFIAKRQIHSGDCAWAVRDHDHDAAAGADAENGLRQCRLAFGIQVGIRLIQNHQERIVVERARERDPLMPVLPTGLPRSPICVP